ncbi:MAG: glycosyl transferase family 2 [Candidatus Eremiobacteraeota bacterium]|nr:glycosyl transferase family 2 [Candidatus Eremiobacteraeota bacterium]
MLLVLAVALESLAGLRALLRMIATAGGKALSRAPAPRAGTVAAIVPVLNEEARVGAALDALARCGAELGEIVVVDGGSVDGTRAVVAASAARDPRVRFIDASPVAPGWNGKAWNLDAGLRSTSAPWVVTVDADVRIGAALPGDAVARANAAGLAALSVATRQELADAGAALLHPALLTTLVYRAGLPNVATGDPARVQANGQVFVARRDELVRADAFRAARASRCEDVTTARVLAAHGGRVGFYEGDAVVRMHDSWRDCAANWPRSLTLRDAFVSRAQLALALAELLLAQALPLPTLIVLLALGDRVPFARSATMLAFVLVLMRLGVLAGTRRAYVCPSPLYWLSPLADLPAVVLLAASALRRTHVWRGRVLVSEHPA